MKMAAQTMAADAPTPHSTNRTGIVLGAFAFALLTGADTCFKLASPGHPAYQILTVSGVFALLLIFFRAATGGGAKLLGTSRPALHLLRAGVGVMSTFAGIYAYSHLALTDYYAIVFAGPLLVTALSALWLKEKVDRARWVAIAAGFCGVLVVANPFAASDAATPTDALIGRLAAGASIFCYAVSVIMVRRMRTGEQSMTFALFGYSVSIVGGLTLWLIFDTPPLGVGDVALLALGGCLGGAGTLCVMEAYYRAPAALVAPFQYTQIFWGALASYALWHLLPGPSLVAGAVIVAASGLFILRRDLRGNR
jgi:drug/metabolite transporter (DMT)-like permease